MEARLEAREQQQPLPPQLQCQDIGTARELNRFFPLFFTFGDAGMLEVAEQQNDCRGGGEERERTKVNTSAGSSCKTTARENLFWAEQYAIPAALELQTGNSSSCSAPPLNWKVDL